MEKDVDSIQEIAQREQKKKKASPKAFKFDFVNKNEEAKPQSPSSASKSSKAFPMHKYLPLIADFREPEDLQESYNIVVDEVLATYNDLRELLFLNYLEDVKDILPNLVLDSPAECVKFFHLVLFQCFEKIKDAKEREESFKGTDEYEKLLQQSESKIRTLIRNENIFRVTFDQCIAKNEECQKIMTRQEKTISGYEKTLDAMVKEKNELAAALKAKEDEILQLQKKGVYIQNIIYNQPKNSPKSENSVPPESAKIKTQNVLNQQNFKLVLNNNTPMAYATAENHMSVTSENRKTPIKIKDVGSKTSRSVESKALFKPETKLEVQSTKGDTGNMKISEIVKLVNVELKKEQRPVTDRKKISISRERGTMTSERLSEWYSFVNSTKMSKSHIASQSSRETKMIPKEEIKTNSEDKSSFYSKTSRVPEPMKTGFRTEMSDDFTDINSATAKKYERKTVEDPTQKMQSKRNKSKAESISISTHRKRKSEVNSNIRKTGVEITHSIITQSDIMKTNASNQNSIKANLAASLAANLVSSKKVTKEHKRSNTTKVSSSLAKLIMDKIVPKNI